MTTKYIVQVDTNNWRGFYASREDATAAKRNKTERVRYVELVERWVGNSTLIDFKDAPENQHSLSLHTVSSPCGGTV